MAKVRCRACGAPNDLGVASCWQCHRSFGDAPPEGHYVPGSAVRAVSMRPSASPAPRRPSSWLSELGGRLLHSLPTLLFVGALALGGWWLWRNVLAGFPFPDEVAGVERIERDETRDVLRLFETSGGLGDLDWELAAYGEGNRPVYAMMAMEIQDDEQAAGVLAEFGRRNPGALNLAAASLMCEPVYPSGSMCAWIEDRTVVALAAEHSDHRALRPLARRLRSEIET
jgi:hypothetical protein